jgi:hypothetical protein
LLSLYKDKNNSDDDFVDDVIVFLGLQAEKLRVRRLVGGLFIDDELILRNEEGDVVLGRC